MPGLFVFIPDRVAHSSLLSSLAGRAVA